MEEKENYVVGYLVIFWMNAITIAKPNIVHKLSMFLGFFLLLNCEALRFSPLLWQQVESYFNSIWVYLFLNGLAKNKLSVCVCVFVCALQMDQTDHSPG